MKNSFKLEIGYYLPLVTLVEIVVVAITTSVPYITHLLAKIPLLNLLNRPLNNLKPVLFILTLVITVVWLVMIVVTFKNQRDNTFRNYYDSVNQTFQLRRFLKIRPKTTQVKVDNGWKNQKINDPAESAFNRAVQGSYIEKQRNNLTVWLLIPSFSDAQVIFAQKLPTIENQIRQDNPNFTFSPAERVGNFYRIEATRY